MIQKIKNKIKSIIEFFKTKGYFNDIWNFDISIANYILPRLKLFIANNHGYPDHLTKDDELVSDFLTSKLKEDGSEYVVGETFGLDLWEYALQKMLIAFELLSSDDSIHYNPETEKQISDGLHYFSKYFRGLWL